MNVTVYGGANAGSDPAYAKAAEELGRMLARAGHTVVYGGGAIGMMGALSHGVIEEGGEIIGVIPHFMMEREWGNPLVSDMRVTETMAERKAVMNELGDIFVAMPGGTGTLEEIAESFSRRNLELQRGKCVFLNINGFYDPMKAMFDAMHGAQFLGDERHEHVVFVDTVEELADCLRSEAAAE